MTTARHAQVNIAIAASVVATVALVLPFSAKATSGGPQSCTVSSTCTIGEFLYDDEYQPINSATCTITAYDPSGTIYINNATMDFATGGWYSHEFTAPTTTGLYRTQVCCTAGSDYLCLDKTFEVHEEVTSGGGGATADEVAAAVWAYSGRTMTSFGSLASDVWSTSSRTLSSFGDLVANFWSRDSTQSAAIAETQSTVEETRLLLEKLVNKPIVETVLEEEIPDLNSKLETTQSIVASADIASQYANSSIGLLVLRWNSMTDTEILENLIDLENKWGYESDAPKDNSFMGQVTWLKNSWNWTEASDIYDQGLAIKSSLSSLKSLVASTGKTKAAQMELKSLMAYLNTLETQIGQKGSTSGKSLYAKLKQTSEIAVALDARGQEIDNLLVNWAKVQTPTLSARISALGKKVIAVNKIPRAETVLAQSLAKQTDTTKKTKNQVLGLRALVASNKLLLSKGSGVSFSNTWLEEGSVIFKTLVTNPSTLISQEVPIKYYLPDEVNEEDIIETDAGLSVVFDSENGRHYVSGTFTLKPSESRAVSVRVDDVWELTPEAVESLRKQGTELSKPLEKTAFFAQGVTLKSDIDVSLDKVLALQSSSVTPEQKIKAYREAEIEMNAAEAKLEKLQELVAQAGSAGNFLGFVGGAQTMAVWGLIIIMGAGFVFLAIYMRTISKSSKTEVEPTTSPVRTRPGRRLAVHVLIIMTSSIFSAAISGLAVRKVVLASVQQPQPTIMAKTAAAPTQVLGEQTAIGGLDVVRIKTSSSKSVNIFAEPTTKASVTTSVANNTEVTRLDEVDGWIEVMLDDSTTGWVQSVFIESPELEETIMEREVVIQETPTGWLRVRQTPGGAEIAKVDAGQRYPLIAEKNGWVQIELADGQQGWVSLEYASAAE